MHFLLVTKLVVLLAIANATPVLIKQVFGDRFAQSIDGGVRFFDRRPLFGSAKTVRGAVASVVLTATAGPLVGLDAATGALIGAMAMVGDLFSSFVKRRLDCAPSSRVTGLDQIPESLFPLLACRGLLSLTVMDIIVSMAVFSVGAILVSPLMHRIGLRDRPF